MATISLAESHPARCTNKPTPATYWDWIDIGGQDSKAITIDSEGLVDNFAMNDRCASGTGRFFDVLARALGYSLEELDDLALAGRRPFHRRRRLQPLPHR